MNVQVEKLQESLFALDSETELLRSQLHAVSQEKTGHAQEVGDLQRKLQEAQDKVGTQKLQKQPETWGPSTCLPVDPVHLMFSVVLIKCHQQL